MKERRNVRITNDYLNHARGTCNVFVVIAFLSSIIRIRIMLSVRNHVINGLLEQLRLLEQSNKPRAENLKILNVDQTMMSLKIRILAFYYKRKSIRIDGQILIS